MRVCRAKAARELVLAGRPSGLSFCVLPAEASSPVAGLNNPARPAGRGKNPANVLGRLTSSYAAPERSGIVAYGDRTIDVDGGKPSLAPALSGQVHSRARFSQASIGPRLTGSRPRAQVASAFNLSQSSQPSSPQDLNHRQSRMNPSAFVNQQPANPYALPPANGTINPTAPGPSTNAAGASTSSGASPAGGQNGDVKMEEAEQSVGPTKEGVAEEGPAGPTKRDQLREEHDLDLAELLDQMDDWKSVVSITSALSRVGFCRAKLERFGPRLAQGAALRTADRTTSVADQVPNRCAFRSRMR